MELNVINELGQEAGKAAASDAVFGREYNEALVHQLVVAYQANARQGTRAQLSREFVRHTTRKPWNQKGTGRARSGMSSSPLAVSLWLTRSAPNPRRRRNSPPSSRRLVLIT